MDWELILEYVNALNKWPLVALVALVILKKPISELIDRLIKIGGSGAEFRDKTNQRSSAAESLPTSDEFDQMMQWGETDLLDEVVAGIDSAFQEKNINTDAAKVEVLRRHLAVTQIYLEFEKTYSLIFGSQISLLRDLNSVSGVGRDQAFIDGWANDRIKRHKHEGWTPKDYMAYLLGSLLVAYDEQSGVYNITVRGQDFLRWLVREQKPDRWG